MIPLDLKTIEQHCNSALLHQKKKEDNFWFILRLLLFGSLLSQHSIRFVFQEPNLYHRLQLQPEWIYMNSIDIFDLWFSISQYIKEELDIRFLIKISPNWFIEVRKEITYFILLFISIQLTLLEIMSQIPISPFQRFLKRFWRKSLLFMLLLRYKIDYIKSDWPVSFKTGYSECLQLSFYFLPKI